MAAALGDPDCFGMENLAAVRAGFLALTVLTVQVSSWAINRAGKSTELLGLMLVLVSSREMICCR